MSKILEKPRCKKCNSTQTYVRLKTNERYCRICSHVEKIKKKIKRNNK